MPAFEEAFGVPGGHSLRLVRTALRGSDVRKWEHEEYDRNGRLVAVYESWSCGDALPAGGRGGGGFVKYSPNGWVLGRSKADTRGRAQPAEEKASASTNQPPSLRRATPRWSA